MKNNTITLIAIILLAACKSPTAITGTAKTNQKKPTANTISKENEKMNTSPLTYNAVPVDFDKINYQNALLQLTAMLKGYEAPDFEKAVFLSESPYHNNKYSYPQFQKLIDNHLYYIKQIIQAYDGSDTINFDESVKPNGKFNPNNIQYLPQEKKQFYKNNLANWAIFSYITDTVYSFVQHDSSSIALLYHPPYTYATADPFGINNWQNSQVIHLLSNPQNTGNCYAFTALYKIFANRLQTQARLCTAPQHIYIQHRDNSGDYYNVELATAGHPTDGILQTLTYTTPQAISSGIALRKYTEQQSIGLCIIQLAKSYEHKFNTRSHPFLLQCANTVLQTDSLNLSALLLKQQVLDETLCQYTRSHPTSPISSHPIYHQLQAHTAKLYTLGYRQMPYDMQKIIRTGALPQNYTNQNPSPFTTITPLETQENDYKTAYKGMLQEVHHRKVNETYGHITYNTSTNSIIAIDTLAPNNELIDPVAFAYDFGARMYDGRIGRFLSVDAYSAKYPNISPYASSLNNPLYLIDPSGDTVTVHVTIEKVGTTNINLFSSDEVKDVVDKKSNKVIKQGVNQKTKEENVYKVVLKNNSGSTATFYYTRIAHRGDKDNPDEEPRDVTFDPSEDGEIFIGKIRSRWKGIDNVLEITPISGDRDDGYDSYRGTADGRTLENRKFIQFHVKGASDGCLLSVGHDQFESIEAGVTIDKSNTGSNSSDSQNNFMQKVKDMMEEDKNINCSEEIRIQVNQLKKE